MLEKFLWALCLLVVLFTEFAWSQTNEIPNEISVTADAEINSPSQISVFTLSQELSSENLIEVEKKLSSQLQDLKLKLKDVVFLSSRIELDPNLKLGKSYLECQTEGSANLANALETAKKSSASIFGKITYKYSEKQQEAIKLAISNAKTKAELISQNLGVKLGAPLSIVVSNEPLGALILQARQLGGPVDPATQPQRARISVQARFAIKN